MEVYRWTDDCLPRLMLSLLRSYPLLSIREHDQNRPKMDRNETFDVNNIITVSWLLCHTINQALAYLEHKIT